jgi:cytochrome d ubiquinol oxidase subunit I
VTAGLLTSDAVSEAVTSGQVLGSIVLFGLIYLLLGAVWVFVLNDKIRAGPEPPRPAAERRHGLLGAAATLAGHEGSMTEAKEER